MRSFCLLSFALLAAASPFAENEIRQVNQCNTAACYQNLQYADSNNLANAQKDCKSYLGTIVTPCPTIRTKTVTGTITVTSTKTIGQKTTTPIPSSSFTTPTPTTTSAAGCTAALTLTNYVPPYASACNANDFGNACSCWGAQQTTSTLHWKTQTQTVTNYAKTKILTVTVSSSSTTTTTTTTSSTTTTTTPSTTTTTTTTSSTTTSTTPTGNGCLATPIINGDFSSGQLSPWTLPNGGPGVVTNSFAPPGKQYSFAVALNETTNTASSLLFQQLNACQGAVYTCSFQHAWQLNAGTLDYFGLFIDIDAVQPVFGWMNTWPLSNHWYTETFTFTAGQDGYNGNDIFMPVYYTPEPTPGYDFVGYFADFQCTMGGDSSSSTTTTTTTTSSTSQTTTTTPTTTSTTAGCLATPVINGDFASGAVSPWVQQKYDGFPNLDNSFPPGQQAYDWAVAISSRCTNCSSGTISQTLNTCAGSTYVCGFQFGWESSNGYGLASEVGLQISRNTDVLLASSMTNYPQQYTYYQGSVTFVAKGNDQINWQFLELTPTNKYYYWVGFLGNFQCAVQSSTTTPTTTTTTTQPTTTACSTSPVTNGDFSSGQLAPWTFPNTGPGGGISSFAPPGKSYSWAGELSSTNNVNRLTIRSNLNSCSGLIYYCSFQHAYTAVSGSPSWLYLYLRVNGGSYIPFNGFMTDYPTAGQWYTESFTMSGVGNDFIDFQWMTYNPSGAYDFTAYIANFQCSTAQAAAN